jgi:hypothetical protein
VWTVSRRCLLLQGTWSCLCKCCPALDFVFAFWIMITFYTLLTSLFSISFEETILIVEIDLDCPHIHIFKEVLTYLATVL